MILLHILSTKQALLGPKISVCGVLISFYNNQSRGVDTLGLYVLASRSNRLIIATFYVKLRDKLENFASFLATTTFPFAFACQPSYLLFKRYAVIVVTKAVLIIADLVRKIKLVLGTNQRGSVLQKRAFDGVLGPFDPCLVVSKLIISSHIRP